MTRNKNYEEQQEPNNANMKSNSNDTESIKPLKRPKKQSYFFKPVNKLTSEAENHTQMIKPIDTNTLRSQIQPVREANGYAHISEYSPKRKAKNTLKCKSPLIIPMIVLMEYVGEIVLIQNRTIVRRAN